MKTRTSYFSDYLIASAVILCTLALLGALAMALTDHALFSHCLPLRRNVKATDAIMDSPACIAIDEAENRLHVQKAIMAALVKRNEGVAK